MSRDLDDPPEHPSLLLAFGIGLVLAGALALWAAGASSVLTVLGWALFGVGALLAAVYGIALAVLVAMRRAEWERTH